MTVDGNQGIQGDALAIYAKLVSNAKELETYAKDSRRHANEAARKHRVYPHNFSRRWHAHYAETCASLCAYRAKHVRADRDTFVPRSQDDVKKAIANEWLGRVRKAVASALPDVTRARSIAKDKVDHAKKAGPAAEWGKCFRDFEAAEESLKTAARDLLPTLPPLRVDSESERREAQLTRSATI